MLDTPQNLLRQAAQARKTCPAAIVFKLQDCGRLPLTGAGMQRGSAAGGDQLPSSSRAPQVSAAAPTAEANSSEHASEDEPSGSEQLSGAAEVMSLEEKIRGDKTNHRLRIQQPVELQKGAASEG